MKLFSSLALLCFFSFSLVAQSPGGVGTTNLRGWFDASTGITLTSGSVSTWSDRSAVGSATQSTSGERPSVSAAALNYNDALSFDGTNDNLELADRVASTATAVSAYAVARQTGTGNDTWGSIFNGQVNGPAWTGGGFGIVALNSGSTLHGFYVRDYNTKAVSTSITNGVPFLLSGTWNGTSASNVQAFKNGVSVGTSAYTAGSVGDAGATWIGSGDGANGNYCFYGLIAELAVFNTGMSVANNNKIMSYLAIKYGLTMGADYSNSAGTTIYNTTGTYTNDIMGITRDDGSGLIQKQSKNEDDSVRIYISSLAASNAANTGSFSADLSHVMVGADNGKMCTATTTSTEIPFGYGITRRIAREWKVTNTNFTGTFSMDFKLNSCAAPGTVTAADLRLLIDDDGNFAAGTNSSIASGASGITITYTNPLVRVSGISNSLIASGATKYITIGAVNFVTPLPISLLKFDALVSKTVVNLNWSTATEKNNDRFDIERSSDGIEFEKIKSVSSKANANSSGILNYSLTDEDPLKGLSYYRLKQVDRDNSFSYSPILAVDFADAKNTRFLIYPNPNQGEFTIRFSGLDENIKVEVNLTDAEGAQVFNCSYNIGKENSIINVAPLNKLNEGLYFCTLTVRENRYRVKVIVRH